MRRLNADPAFAAANAERMRARRKDPAFREKHEAAFGFCWDEAADKRLRQLRAKNIGLAKCGELLGCSEPTVRRHMRRLGLPTTGWSTTGLHPRYRARQIAAATVKWSDAMDAVLKRLREMGTPITKCAETLEVSVRTVGKRLDVLKLPRRLP